MLHIIATIIIGLAFWRAVFWAQEKLMVWIHASEVKSVESNDRVRELAWWAAIGVIGVFTVVAHIVTQLLLLAI
mgnify:CR=1 FL=1